MVKHLKTTISMWSWNQSVELVFITVSLCFNWLLDCIIGSWTNELRPLRKQTFLIAFSAVIMPLNFGQFIVTVLLYKIFFIKKCGALLCHDFLCSYFYWKIDNEPIYKSCSVILKVKYFFFVNLPLMDMWSRLDHLTLFGNAKFMDTISSSAVNRAINCTLYSGVI